MDEDRGVAGGGSRRSALGWQGWGVWEQLLCKTMPLPKSFTREIHDEKSNFQCTATSLGVCLGRNSITWANQDPDDDRKIYLVLSIKDKGLDFLV